MFYMSQLSADAEGKVLLNQSMMEGSRTGKAAEADLMVLIAKDPVVINPDGSEAEEGPLIRPTYAVVDPWAVMIELPHAVPAFLPMMGPGVFAAPADHAHRLELPLIHETGVLRSLRGHELHVPLPANRLLRGLHGLSKPEADHVELTLLRAQGHVRSNKD